MSLSTHYALSVPRGTKIVVPVSFGTIMLAPAIVDNVRYLWPGDPERQGDHCVELTLDGEPVLVPSWLRLTVENDTPQRNRRVAYAHALLAFADASPSL